MFGILLIVANIVVLLGAACIRFTDHKLGGIIITVFGFVLVACSYIPEITQYLNNW